MVKTMKKRWMGTFFLFFTMSCLCTVVSAGDIKGTDDIEGTYLMDNIRHRRIIIAYIKDGIYRIEEPSGSWPWKGCGVIENNMVFGIAKFKGNKISMMLRGNLYPGRLIKIQYIFMTDKYGKLNTERGPERGRVDSHVWYKIK